MAESDLNKDDFEEFIFYRDRPEWKDVTPIPQDDGENLVVAISYSEKFKDVYDYFRAILQTSEKSKRALQLTHDALELNPANYTVWQYRREILFAIGSDLWDEVAYVQKIIEDTPKNYQVWHHRRVLIDHLKDGSRELDFTAIILKQDAKNYHAWQHRQWALKTFDLYENELTYVNSLLDEDLRNNSAWNQRYFVINNTTGFVDDVLNKEIEYTLSKIEVAKDNESAWNYLRGLLLHESRGLSQNTTVSKFCENLYKSENRSPFLLALIVDICEEVCSTGAEDSWFTMELAQDICEQLATEHDTIREKYWNNMAENLKAGGSAEKERENSAD